MEPGDEVIVPPYTMSATAMAPLVYGGVPVFVDIESDSFNIAPDKIAAKLSDKTKAILPVHLFGLCADIDAIRAVVPDHVKIIEDAACAAGSGYKDKWAGSLADAGVFDIHTATVDYGEGAGPQTLPLNPDH